MSKTNYDTDQFDKYTKFLNDADTTITVPTEWVRQNPDKMVYDTNSNQFMLDTSDSNSVNFTLTDSSSSSDNPGMPIPAGTIASDVQPLANLLRQSEGSGARLRIGRYLSHYHQRGFAYRLLRQYLESDENVTLPSDGRCSVYRGAYDAWLGQDVKSSIIAASDVEPGSTMRIGHPEALIALEDGSMVRLADFPIDKLYLLRHQLKEKPVEEVLALARAHNEGTLRAMLKGGQDITQADPAKPISDIATLKLPRSIYDNLDAFVTRLRTITGKHDITWGAALEFMLGQFDPTELDEASLDFLWRYAHGELTPEEGAELQREYYTTR